MYCTVLYCIVMYCTVLYCIVLYCTVLCCAVLYCTVLLCTVLYCTVLSCTVLYCTIPRSSQEAASNRQGAAGDSWLTGRRVGGLRGPSRAFARLRPPSPALRAQVRAPYSDPGGLQAEGLQAARLGLACLAGLAGWLPGWADLSGCLADRRLQGLML